MMMKTLKTVFTLLLFSLSALLISTSCNKETPFNEKSTSKITGQWKWNYEDEEDPDYILYCIFTFKEDGTGTYFEYDGGHIDSDNRPFYYTYDDQSTILTLMWLKNNTVHYTESSPVKWINDQTFICDIIEEGGIFKKIASN